MRGKIIVVEGPDNAGKSTFAMALCKRMKGIYIKGEKKVPRPRDDVAGYQHILNIAAGYSGLVVSDRHPMISEPIYGKLLRGGHQLSSLDIDRAMVEVDMYVYCRPPRAAIMSTIMDREQMEGVAANSLLIIQAYDDFFSPQNWDPDLPPVYRYDYTTPASADFFFDQLSKDLA